ncbi:matrix-remodeling-associated protein 5 [Menidia menidia]
MAVPGPLLGLVLVVLVVPVRAGAGVPCPRLCACPRPAELHCTFRSLSRVPERVPERVQRVNLGFNSIGAVSGRALAGLGRLELLLMHGNELRELADGAFRDLGALQTLKLSFNRLTEIGRHTLQGLASLARLHLDHNRLQSLHPQAFQGLSALRLLQLEGNRLQQLHPATLSTFTLRGHFQGSTLRHLYLSDNELTTLPEGLLGAAAHLENLYLHGNPWACDCNMGWFQRWMEASPGVLRCKKDRALPGGELCPVCSSPGRLRETPLGAVQTLGCSRPVISAPQRTTAPEEDDGEVLTAADFPEPLGNASLSLSDEHGNEVDLNCGVLEPGELTHITWEQVPRQALVSNVTFSVDLDCPVDRGKYEQLWRLVAYYSSVPAHLTRGLMVSKEPRPTYLYRQDSVMDAQYYTGVKVQVTARPDWLMQPSVELQLNRPQSSARTVRLTLRAGFSDTVQTEAGQGETRPWVMIQATNKTRRVVGAVPGSPAQLHCEARGSDRPAVRWILPDGSRMDAPSGGADDRVIAQDDGRLVLKAVSHSDAGVYYCLARVQGELSVQPFRLTVQEPFGPPQPDVSVEVFVGSPVSLDCATSGSPDPDVNWILPSSQIVSFQANSSRAFVYPNGSLNIPQVQLSDSGHYKCVAMNQHGVDTLAAKVLVLRRKGPIRPLRKFPARPQSASGVSTQITVPTEDMEGASGDQVLTQDQPPMRRLEPIRRRIPGSAVPGGGALHPSRKTWRRPPVVRTPTGSRADNRKATTESRRRIHMANNKIDPEKWAHILAKIRDRGHQTTAAPPPMTLPSSTLPSTTLPPMTIPPTTLPPMTIPSTTLPPMTLPSTTLPPMTLPSTTLPPMTIPSTTLPPMTIPSTTLPPMTLPPMTIPSSTLLSTTPPSTTPPSASPDAKEGSRGSIIAHEEEGQLYVTTHPPGQLTITEEQDEHIAASATPPAMSGATLPLESRPDLAVSSRNDKGPFWEGSQTFPSVVSPNDSETGQEENGKYVSEAAASSQFLTQPHNTTLFSLPASPTSTPVPTLTVKPEPQRPPSPRPRKPSSRRRNGPRKKRPNRGRQKGSKATPVNTPLPTVWTELTGAPAGSELSSPGRLSHKEGSVSAQAYEEAGTSPEQLVLARAPAWFPTASPAEDLRHTVSGTLAPSPQLWFTDSRPTETGVSAGLGSSGGFHTVTQLPENNQSGRHGAPPDTGGEALRKEDLSFLSPPSASAASPIEDAARYTSGNPVGGLLKTSIKPPEDDTQTERGPTVTPTAPAGHFAQSWDLYDTPERRTKANKKLEETAVTHSVTTATSYPVRHSTDGVLNPRATTPYPRNAANQSREQKLITASQPHQPPSTSPPLWRTANRTVTSLEAPPTSSPDVSAEPRLPGRGAVPGGRPRISGSSFQTVAVKAETDAQLPCEARGRPVPFLSWTSIATGVRLAEGSRVPRFEVHPNGTLSIRKAQPMDGGRYLCTAQNRFGVDQRTVRLVVVASPPAIQQTPRENVTLPEGGAASFHCTATGAPRPDTQWVAPDGADNLLVFPNGTLHIRDVRPQNSGTYECSASNPIASSKRTVTLTVRKNLLSAKANILSSSAPRTDVIYGSRLLLNCVAGGEPEPRVMWRTPSKKLVDAQYSFDPRIKVFVNGTITIQQVTDKDGGDYLCVARNKMGDDYVQLRVNVLTRPAKIEQKQQPSSQEVVYGTDLKVDCVASGLPDPEIRWALPDGTMVNPIKQRDGVGLGRSRRYVVFDNGTLYFNDVGTPEEGDYTCYAENQLGKDEMKVRVKVKAATSPPRIQRKEHNTVRVFYGETATLQCSTKGEPEPVITWVSPTNKVIFPSSDKYQVLNDGTLVVRKTQRIDGGNYTCIARSRVGQDHKVTRLEILVTPPVITVLRGTANAVKLTAVQDQRKSVDCAAKGTPTPRIVWVLPGNVILPAPYHSNRITVHPNGTLDIHSPKKTDSGQLTCVARNEGGEARLVVDLEVKEASEGPQIRDPRADSLSLTVGNAITINCSYEGLTLPNPTWILPNGTPLHSGARFSKFFHRLDGSLVIGNPTLAEAGTYRCLGHRSGGVVERRITLSPGRKPEISNSYASPVSVNNGETLFLHCQTTSEPLRLSWTLPSGVLLSRPQRAGRYAVLPNGTLAIRQVSVYDRGPYVCRASNEYGSSLLSASVTVMPQPPRITSGPPSVTYAKHGVAVQLNCVATGFPKVEVAWETPDKTRLVVSAHPRLFGNKYLHPQGSLIIQNPMQRDTGVYRCTARNDMGVDSKATFLNVF